MVGLMTAPTVKMVVICVSAAVSLFSASFFMLLFFVSAYLRASPARLVLFLFSLSRLPLHPVIVVIGPKLFLKTAFTLDTNQTTLIHQGLAVGFLSFGFVSNCCRCESTLSFDRTRLGSAGK